MKFNAGEKVLSKIERIGPEKIIISLREDVKGYADKSCISQINEDLSPGLEVYVTILEASENQTDMLKVRIDKVLNEDKFTDDPDKYLNGVQAQHIREKYNSSTNSCAKDLVKWFKEADQGLKKLRKHRAKRLNEEFYVD